MKDGGPAFPIQAQRGPDAGGMTWFSFQAPSSGMSLRDYFAAAALPLVLKTGMYNDSMVARQQGGQTFNDALASQCYQIADAMLKEHEKSVPVEPQGEPK